MKGILFGRRKNNERIVEKEKESERDGEEPQEMSEEDKEEFDKEKEKLEKEKESIRTERENIQKEKQDLQKERQLFEEEKRKWQQERKERPSSSEKPNRPQKKKKKKVTLDTAVPLPPKDKQKENGKTEEKWEEDLSSLVKKDPTKPGFGTMLRSKGKDLNKVWLEM